MDKYIKLAIKRILPPGFKPEDYLIISNDIPLRLAKLIANEVKHMKKMELQTKKRKKLFEVVGSWKSRRKS